MIKKHRIIIFILPVVLLVLFFVYFNVEMKQKGDIVLLDDDYRLRLEELLCGSLKAVSNENEDVRLNFSVVRHENSGNMVSIYAELNIKDSSAGQADTREESFCVESVNVVITGDNGFFGMIQAEPEEFFWKDGKMTFDLSAYNRYDLKMTLGLNFPRNVYLEEGELVPSKLLEERSPELITRDSVNNDEGYQSGILLPQGSYNISVQVQYENGGQQNITAQLPVSVKGNGEWQYKAFEIEDGIIGKVYYKTKWNAGEYIKWYCVLENADKPVEIKYNGQGCLPLMTTKDGEEVSGLGWLADEGSSAVWNPGTLFFEEWGTLIENPGKYKVGFWYILEINGEKCSGNCLVDVNIK